MTPHTDGETSLPPKPARMPINAAVIHRGMKARRQWVVWEWKLRDDKWTKPPFQPTGRPASVTDSGTWVSFEEALEALYTGEFDGIGFVLTADDPFAIFDLDHCLEPDGDAYRIEGWAQQIIDDLDSYTEITPSDTGLRVILRAVLPPGGRKRGNVEAYDDERYITVTGQRYGNYPDVPKVRHEQTAMVHARELGQAKTRDVASTSPTATADPDDLSLIKKARNAKNGTKFSQLFDGDWRGAGYASQSNADLALCSLLAYWAGNDVERMDRLFRQSALLREKWDERHHGDGRTYGQGTIDLAVETTEDVYDQQGSKPKKESAQIAALAIDDTLFHDPEGHGFATIVVDGHEETWELQSLEYHDLLRHRFYLTTRKPPGKQALEEAIQLLDARARFDGPENQVFTRIGHHDGGVYLDLCNEDWEVVEITGQGWSVIQNPPVKFTRYPSAKSLPRPSQEGSIKDLRKLINVPDDDHWKLVIGWLIWAMNPHGPYPILIIRGEQGSAKSTLNDLLISLVSPSAGMRQSLPRKERDLMVGATRNWVVAYDNVSSLRGWMSDALCRLATGTSLAIRKLYTDRGEEIFIAKRPVILNGITDFVHRSDLLSRAIVIDLPPVPDDNRQDERQLWSDFEAARPSILGGLLDAVSTAVREFPHTKVDVSPRMVDFTKWVVAAEPALPWGLGEFLTAYLVL